MVLPVFNGGEYLKQSLQSILNQDLYESEYEHHVSHWTLNDFKKLGFTDSQYFDGGAVYLLSKERLDIRGFGNSVVKKIRRVARAVRNEL